MTGARQSGGIPPEIIDQIRERSDLIQIMSERFALKKAGSSFRCLCPFHDDHNPSMSVSPDKQVYHCFTCGASGNVITFVMEMDGLSFPEAVRCLADRAGIVIPERSTPRDEGRKDRLGKMAELHSLAVRFYQDQLAAEAGRAAREYLAARGFEKRSLLTFKIGYAPDAWEGLLRVVQGKFSAEVLEASGLFIKSEKKAGKFYDRFRGRVMFPITDLRGRTIGFGGRILEAKEDQPKYLNSPETDLFQKGRNLYGLLEGREALRKENVAVVTEGYTDVVLCHQAGLQNVAAGLGTALTEDQARLLHRLVEEVVLLYDPDEAGRKAAERAMALCLAQGLRVRAAVLPEGEDPADFVKAHGLAALQERIQQGRSVLDFFVERANAAGELAAPDGRSKLAHRVLETIAGMPDAIRRDAYIAELADRLGIEKAVLVRQSRQEGGPSGETRAVQTPKGDWTLDAELSLLKLLLELLWEERFPVLSACRKHLKPEEFSKPIRGRLYDAILTAEDPSHMRPAVLMDRLEGEADDFIAFLSTKEMAVADSERMGRDFILQIKKQRFEEDLAHLKGAMAGASPAEAREISRRIMELQQMERGLRSLFND